MHPGAPRYREAHKVLLVAIALSALALVPTAVLLMPERVGSYVPVTVTGYTAELDGTVLVERITYRLEEAGKTMIYRSWDTPLVPGSSSL